MFLKSKREKKSSVIKDILGLQKIMLDLNLSKQTEPSTNLRIFSLLRNLQPEIYCQIYQEFSRFFKSRRLARKWQVSNIHLSDQNQITLYMSNISLSKYINFYRRGRNSNNTHFNFTGIKDYTLEKNSNRKKGLKA